MMNGEDSESNTFCKTYNYIFSDGYLRIVLTY